MSKRQLPVIWILVALVKLIIASDEVTIIQLITGVKKWLLNYL